MITDRNKLIFTLRLLHIKQKQWLHIIGTCKDFKISHFHTIIKSSGNADGCIFYLKEKYIFRVSVRSRT